MSPSEGGSRPGPAKSRSAHMAPPIVADMSVEPAVAGAAPDPAQERNPPLIVDLRIVSDKQLVRHVRSHGGGSAVAREFEDELKDAGIGAIHTLLKNKTLFRRLDALKIFVPHQPPAGFWDAFRSLVYLAVYTAVPVFIDEYVFDGKWDPNKGSLRTAVVNACLCQFGVEYRRFCTEEGHRKTIRIDLTKTGEYDELEPDTTGPYAPRSSLGPEERALRIAALEWILSIRSISPEDKMILIREAQGYNHQEIGAEFNLKPATVGSRLRRLKVKIAEIKERRGEIDGSQS